MSNRYPVFKRNKAGQALCRGCGKLVPKGRQTWCSKVCYELREPSRIRYYLEQRDKGICSMCGVDTKKMQAKLKNLRDYVPNYYDPRFWGGRQFLQEKFDRAKKIYERHKYQLYRAIENRRKKLVALGWPRTYRRDWWEMDHIIPHSEGGEMLLSNMRTLCVLCHKKRTKAWHTLRVKKTVQQQR